VTMSDQLVVGQFAPKFRPDDIDDGLVAGVSAGQIVNRLVVVDQSHCQVDDV